MPVKSVKIKKVMAECKSKEYYGYREGIISVFINTILFALKYWVGITTSSIAIVADAWHSLSDSFTSLIVIIGFKISSKKPDYNHPFGHGRAEIISSVVMCVALAFVGLEILAASVNRFQKHEEASYNVLAFFVILLSIIVKEILARYSIGLGKKMDSKSLVADGWHHRSDSITSVLVIIVILAGKSFWWLDSVAGMVVSIFIVYVAVNIVRGSVSSLLGEEPDDDFKDELYRLVAGFDLKEEDIHHIHMHKYGDHIELTFHLFLPPQMNLRDAHSIADRIEEAVREKMKAEATIHIEPAGRRGNKYTV